MRIEDLDPPRVVPGSAEEIMADLAWLGLDWDEGPDVGGPYRPYVQSQRFATYAAAVEVLEEKGLIFRCTCTRKELQAIASAPHGDSDLGPRYPGTCLHGPTHPERPSSRRFHMPPSEAFIDLLRGAWPEGEPDNFVVQRSDGHYAYQLAVVVDDIAMGVTEVVRGDDLLSSTPRQIALYRALDAQPPAFLHVPLGLGADGERLSKRNGATAIAELREQGMTPEQVIGVLGASLGMVSHGTTLSAPELVPLFAIERLSREPFRFDSLRAPRE